MFWALLAASLLALWLVIDWFFYQKFFDRNRRAGWVVVFMVPSLVATLWTRIGERFFSELVASVAAVFFALMTVIVVLTRLVEVQKSRKGEGGEEQT